MNLITFCCVSVFSMGMQLFYVFIFVCIMFILCVLYVYKLSADFILSPSLTILFQILHHVFSHHYKNYVHFLLIFV